MIIYGRAKDLSFKPNNQKLWLDFLEKHDGKNIVLDVSEEKPKRTLDQNALYWMYLTHIEKETGSEARTMHELFKRKFLPPIHQELFGIKFKIPSSTTELSKAEFSEYLDKIAQLTEISLPEPIKKEFEIPVAYPINNLEPKL